jgi:D-serine deaminase-like pyridoxal phosphate-dependent protein
MILSTSDKSSIPPTNGSIRTSTRYFWVKKVYRQMSDYFKTLNEALRQANFALPTLIIDQAQLDANLAQVKKMLPLQIKPRLVVKSLSSVELLKYIANDLNCERFMVFHLPHVPLVFNAFPNADILIGKPMPITAVKSFYAQHPSLPQTTIQWLIDRVERLHQYLELAKTFALKLSINIEIDVGLHRGGVQNLEQFRAILTLIQNNPEHLQLSGLMGYDAHVGKIPRLIQSTNKTYQRSQAQYQTYITCIDQQFPSLKDANLCFNGSGSPTFSLHAKHSLCNDISFGSMLLKPADFDLATLNDFQPALWIAAPVLKKLPATQIPGLGLLNKIPTGKNALFIYGGYWMAKYVYPKGAQINAMYGRSTNQELVNVPKSSDIQIDDFVFLRPTQSEAVISQFEQVWLYAHGGFTPWVTFKA